VLIIANNHYRGKGPANALMLKSMLTQTRVKAPASLARLYKELAAVAVPEDKSAPRQRRLF
jgi:uracil DNA glycosylase